jgi:hypothetical protein
MGSRTDYIEKFSRLRDNFMDSRIEYIEKFSRLRDNIIPPKYQANRSYINNGPYKDFKSNFLKFYGRKDSDLQYIDTSFKDPKLSFG